MDHPKVAKVMRFGYPDKDEVYGEDDLGNTVYVGERILVLEFMYFLEHALDDRLKQVFYELGATSVIAGK